MDDDSVDPVLRIAATTLRLEERTMLLCNYIHSELKEGATMLEFMRPLEFRGLFDSLALLSDMMDSLRGIPDVYADHIRDIIRFHEDADYRQMMWREYCKVNAVMRGRSPQ